MFNKGATLPSPDQLPDDIAALAQQHGTPYSDEHDAASLDKLARLLRARRQWWRHRRVLLAALVLLCVVSIGALSVWVSARLRPPAVAAVSPRFEARVWRDGAWSGLSHAMPLRSGDELQFVVELPSGYLPTLFWYDTEGQLHEFRLDEPVEGGITTGVRNG